MKPAPPKNGRGVVSARADGVLLDDFANCADMPVTVLNEKAGSHVLPMTAAAASLFLLAAAPNKYPGAVVGALLSTRAAEDVVDAVSNKNTAALLLQTPIARGFEASGNAIVSAFLLHVGGRSMLARFCRGRRFFRGISF
jgi:hypothetical protein